MKIYEIGTGYTSIPATISAATEIVVEQLTRAMIKNGKDVEIVDIQDKNRKKCDLKINEIRMPAFFHSTDTSLGLIHKLKRVIYSVSLAKYLKKILKTTDEQVIFHFHNQYNMFFFLKLTSPKDREKCVMAYTNHSGIWSLDWDEVKGTLMKRYFQEWECIKKADILYLFNDDNITKNNIINHVGADEKKIVKRSNGVNLQVYYPLTPQEKEAVKAEYGLTNKKIILQIGSIYDNKGQDRALKYLTPIMKKNKDLMYVYAGGVVDEEYHEALKKYIADKSIENQVKYLGMLPPGEQLNRVYNMAEAMILPSKYEAFGMVVIESYAAGLPVLINKQVSFSFNGGAVLYTEEDFEHTLKSNILNNPTQLELLRKRVRSIALDNYSWEIIAKQYTDSWENMGDKNG